MQHWFSIASEGEVVNSRLMFLSHVCWSVSRFDHSVNSCTSMLVIEELNDRV